MPARRRYTKSEKASAVGQALATSLEAASDNLGIPKSTLDYWVKHPQFAELRTKTRDEVAETFWAAIQVGVDQVTIGLTDADTPLRDKATALGILWDKHTLMTGGSTSRTEARDISGTMTDVELQHHIHRADSILALARAGAGRAPQAVEDAPEG